MEINVALDELLGLRGPLSTLVRNLLWLLAFNATYLGIFTFIPRTVGSAIYAGVFNTTACSGLLKKLPYVYSESPDNVTAMGLLYSLNEESSRLNTSFRLPDLTTVTLGYFSMAFVIVFIRYSWLFAHKVKTRFTPEQPHTNPEEVAHPLLHGPGRREGAQLHGFDDQDAMEHGGASVAVGLALDATVAVVKVGILLFLKMFLLPLLLGLWLDASTTTLFGHDVSDRIAYAASDLFSFVLLHWVAGITFMLLVTVFLLQLREVTHPDVLARLIRPQEPQPDLLGNLMNESVSTHMKRMFLSLGIYAPLLTMHVTIPVKLVVASGLGNYFSFFRLNFWHLLMPQMQIPLELIIFHLSMLALLERYKNTIGELQHHWLIFMCRRMGLTDYILPRSIEKFQLLGQKNLFLSKDAERAPDQEDSKEPSEFSSIQRTTVKVDPFWYELSSKSKAKTDDIDEFILSNFKKDTSASPVFTDGEANLLNGERVVARATASIRLPAKEENGTPEQENHYLLPMSIGRFRLRRVGPPDAASVVELWQEVPGGEIPRPPEGWDDLGAGGAFVQGRWAWGKERRSVVEGGVAQRTPFREPGKKRRPIHLMMKVAALIICSWIAITFTIFGIVSTPLAVGRSFYYLFRVPQKYIHDPFAFCMGGCLFFPVASLVASTVKEAARHSTMKARFQRWISRFHLPPRQKLLIFLESWFLWSVIAPLALGVSYEIAAVKLGKWFAGEERLFDPVSMALCWTVGTFVLNSWAFFSYYSVFTGQFWANIGNGILEPPLDENDGAAGIARNNRNARGAAAENAEEVADGQIRGWQGKNGRVAKFFGVWKSVLFQWEWESVNKVPLLEEFARPITRQLASTIVGSTLSFQLSFVLATALLQVEQNGIVGKSLNRVIFVLS
jgi:E3 ubiquitin-protein ligase MARCH6